MKQTDVLQPEPGWAVKFPARLTPPPVSQRGLVFRGLALITSALGRKDVPDYPKNAIDRPGTFEHEQRNRNPRYY